MMFCSLRKTLDELLRVLTEPKVVRQLRITNEILVSTGHLVTLEGKVRYGFKEDNPLSRSQ